MIIGSTILLALSLASSDQGPEIDGRMADLIVHSDEDNPTELDRLDLERFGWLRPYVIIVITDQGEYNPAIEV
jgi:hypothetical protein